VINDASDCNREDGVKRRLDRSISGKLIWFISVIYEVAAVLDLSFGAP